METWRCRVVSWCQLGSVMPARARSASPSTPEDCCVVTIITIIITHNRVFFNVAHPHINICRAVIQNGSRETGFPRAFLNGQFRLRKAKIGKKTNNFPLCCQLRLRTATEWVSHVLCAMVTLGSAVPY